MLAAALMAPAASHAKAYYGFAPNETPASELIAIGSGRNAFLEAVVSVDASKDPLVAKLKGSKITGVRFYLRADFKQKSKGFSQARIYTDGLEKVTQSVTEDFVEGWNEVSFATPVEIGDKPIYVGYQVFETQGEPFPIAAYKNARIPGVSYINPARGGWDDYGDRGAVMIQAVVDADPALLDGHAVVAPMNEPLVVAPDKDFSCTFYIHNQSDKPVTSLTYSSYDENGYTVDQRELTLSEPIAPYGSAAVGAALKAPSAEGSSVPLTVTTTKLNGADAGDCFRSIIRLYVSSDVFFRVPVVEEFTGILCTNCPFMFYYLDSALEKMTTPHVYVAHHDGYYKDALTQACDTELLYLFGDNGTYNPAVMYDRRVMSGSFVPVESAKSEASDAQYTQRIAEAMGYPALAKVLVDEEISANGAKCRVYGKISKAAMDMKDDLYLTVYFLEDRIPTEVYGQKGLDPVPDGAPEDLLDRFCHRGVIRRYFGGETGSKLEVDSDGSFDVSFDFNDIASSWNLDNCEFVAFVHRVNKENMADNYVLNAGAMRCNDYAEHGAALPGVSSDITDAPAIGVGADRRLTCSDASVSLEAYGLDGRRLDAASPLAPGLYVVAWRDNAGRSGAVRVLVR